MDLLEDIDEVVAQFSKHKLLCRNCVRQFNDEGIDDFEQVLLGFLPLLNMPLGREMVSGREDQRECVICGNNFVICDQNYDRYVDDDDDDCDDRERNG